MFMRIATLIARAVDPRANRSGICITQAGDGTLRAPWVRELGNLGVLDEISTIALKHLMRWDDRRAEEFLSAWEIVIVSAVHPVLTFAYGTDVLAVDGLLELVAQVIKTVLGCDFAGSTLQIAVRWEKPSVTVICQGLPRSLASWQSLSNAWLPCISSLAEQLESSDMLPVGACPLGYWLRIHQRRDLPRRLRQEALAQLSMKAQYKGPLRSSCFLDKI